MGNLIIVSSDSHAAMPSELWTEYFEKRFHEHLPQIQYESDLYSGSVVPLSKMSMERPEIAEDHFSPTGGYRGVYDRAAYASSRWIVRALRRSSSTTATSVSVISPTT